MRERMRPRSTLRRALLGCLLFVSAACDAASTPPGESAPTPAAWGGVRLDAEPTGDEPSHTPAQSRFSTPPALKLECVGVPLVRLLEERSLPAGGVCRHEVRLDGVEGPAEALTHHRLLVLGAPSAKRCLEVLSKLLAGGEGVVRQLPTEDDTRPEFIAASETGEVAVGVLWVEPDGGAFQVLQVHLSESLLRDARLGAAHAERWRRLLRALAAAGT